MRSQSDLILLFSLVPPNLIPGIADSQKDLLASQSYVYIRQNLLPKFPQLQNIYLTLSVLKDPTKNEQLSGMKEFTDFYKNPKIQDLIENAGIKSSLAGKHFLQLLSNPKLRAVLTDDALMAKLSQLSKKIHSEQITASTTNRQ